MTKGSCKDLFVTFLKIGAFTFGGGYAMIPLIKREVVENKKWLEDGEVLDVIAIAESTPGPLAINAATFVGSRVAGVKGALAATTGVVLPSFFIILIISQVLFQIENLDIVKHAFAGIRAGVLVLIISALVSLFGKMQRNAFTYVIAVAALVLILIFNVNTLLVLLICGVAGGVWSCMLLGREKH